MPEAISDSRVVRSVTAAAQDVLETMFFAMIDEEAEHDGACELVSAGVSFAGSFAGRLEICLPAEAAAAIATDFLGLDFDEVPTSQQVDNVMGELVNMICGTALSRLDSKSTFDLKTPERLDALGEVGGGTVEMTLPLEQGILTIHFVAQ